MPAGGELRAVQLNRKTLRLAAMKFSTTLVEKLCGKVLFATDKFLKHLDFQQIAHVSGESSFSLRSAVCIYETPSWREHAR